MEINGSREVKGRIPFWALMINHYLSEVSFK
jgi:hypothetical protein